jgi:PAS domain S-box-containing protein
VKQAHDTSTKQTCELELLKKDGTSLDAFLESVSEPDGADMLNRMRTAITDITSHKQMKTVLEERTQELGERVKELNCLIEMSKLMEKPGISLDGIIQGTVDLIPAALQYPESTYVRVNLGGRIYSSRNFRETVWKQDHEIMVSGDRVGTLEVYCTPKREETAEEDAFLNEERILLKTIAERTGKTIERIAARNALRESEEKYRTLVENANDGIIVVQDEMLKFVNSRAAEIVGFLEPELTYSPFAEFIHPDDRGMVAEHHIKRLKGEEELETYDFRVLDKGGKVKWLRNRGVIIQWEGRPATLNFLTDITEIRKAEEHIHILSQELIKAHESERQMISRELHDRIAQDLSTAKINCDLMVNCEAISTHPDVRQKMTHLSHTLQRSISNVREMAYDLRPPGLDEVGLAQTLFEYCTDFAESNGLRVDFRCAGLERLALDFETGLNLYRLVQEGLNNIRKHAEARRVVLRLVASAPNIVLRIEDDGKGFDVQSRLIAARQERRMGLQSMEERVKLLQGRMRVRSRLNMGTEIFIKIPYEKKA